MPLAHWEFIIGVNFWWVVHCLHAFLPGMVGRDFRRSMDRTPA
jgi:hypothetical protein